jgi:hypothetical protein
MSFKSLMKGREVVVDVWLATIKGEGRLILILLVMEVR